MSYQLLQKNVSYCWSQDIAEGININNNKNSSADTLTDSVIDESATIPSAEPLISAKLHSQTQEELSKKLEEFRIASRSTKASFVDRPRAKSEEAMIKFSNESMFQPRCRLQSDSESPKNARSGF